MRSIYIYLFFAITGLSFAQTTGYMGKRLLLNYGIHTSPAIFGSNAGNESIIGDGGSAETGSLAFNLIHEGSLEFALSSKWMMCFSGRYYKTTFDNHTAFRNNYYYNGGNQMYFPNKTPEGYYNIQGLTYTLYFKYYGSRYVAPWGRYIMFGPTINTVKTTYDPAIMKMRATYEDNYYQKDTMVSNFGSKEQSYSGFNIMFGLGRSRIYGNRVVVDYGANFQMLSLLSTLFDVADFHFSSTKTIDNTNYIESTVKSRVRGVNRFNVFLKIGLLLY